MTAYEVGVVALVLSIVVGLTCALMTWCRPPEDCWAGRWKRWIRWGRRSKW